MRGDLQKISEIFPNRIIPERIRSFYEFVSDNYDGDFISFENIDDGKDYLSHLIIDKFQNEFIPFYVCDDHTIYMIWIGKGANPDIINSPVAFLGADVGVFTQNFDEFLLLYSKGLGEDIFSACRGFIEMPKYTIDPNETYSQDKLGKHDLQMSADYPAYGKMQDWIKNLPDFRVNKTVVQIVEDTIKTQPDLYEYLSSNKALVQEQ